MSLSVKNCMQLYTIEKSQMTADEIGAFVSLSHEKSMEQSGPGLMEQFHSHQQRGSASAISSEPMASMHSPLCSKMAAEAPALTFVLPATEGPKVHLSQLNDLPFKQPFRKST